MIVDVLFLVFLIVFFLRGYKKGFVIALFAVFSIIIGILCALKFSGLIATLLFDSKSTAIWIPFVSYILVFAITVWLVRLGAKAIDKLLDTAFLGWANRLSGALLYGFLAAFIFSTFLWLSSKLNLISIETQTTSRCYAFLVDFAPSIFSWLGNLIPFVKDLFSGLSSFFDSIKAKV